MRTVARLVILAVCCGVAVPAAAQYAELPRPLPGAGSSGWGGIFQGAIRGAAQIGRRLFVGGRFSRLSDPTGNAVVVDPNGTLVPNAFPIVAGYVGQVVADGVGGWFLAGAFTSVDGRPAPGFARVTPQRTLDARFLPSLDGAVGAIAVAHGRVYLAGQFAHVNGARREGLAALSLATGQLEAWGAGFGTGGRTITSLSASSTGIYLAASGSATLPSRLWGFDGASGRLLFARTNFIGVIAASSSRVYVGGYGYERPVWAIDPQTGEDTSWVPNLTFQYQSGTYGEYTSITSILLDGGRLYFAGRFATTDGRGGLAAVDAETGVGLPWRPPFVGSYGTSLTRVGPAVLLTTPGGSISAVSVATAAPFDSFRPSVFGAVSAVAPAPEGVVLVGSFAGAGGVPRPGLAAIDVDTYAVEPWTPALTMPGGGFVGVEQVETDGTWLFVRTGDGRVAKIDPVSGAVAAERQFPSPNADLTRMTVANGQVVVSSFDQVEEVGVLSVADWSYRVLPVSFSTGYGSAGYVTRLAADGDTLYLAGNFATVNGQPRPFLAAVHAQTGAVLDFRPAPNTEVTALAAAGGHVWVGGRFRRIGGARRRGLAALDPTTGAARPWNPDAIGVLQDAFLSPFDVVSGLAVSGDTIYAALGNTFVTPAPTDRPTVSGQRTGYIVAFSMTTGTRLPWRPPTPSILALTPDCLMTSIGCLPPAEAPATGLGVATAGPAVTLSWTLPASATRTGVRVEVGSRDGLSDLLVVDLPAGQTSFGGTIPAGSYVARVRTLAGAAPSPPTSEVSFAVGASFAAAPLDATAIVDDTQVTFAWRPPTTGAPTGYEVALGVAEGRRDAVITAPGGATSVVFSGPPARYWARVVTTTATGRSTPGQELFVEATYAQMCGSTAGAPVGLTASVSGRVVTLSWQPPADGPQTDPQQIVAGSVPGASDLATLPLGASATSFSVTAPPGTYYVRVEATNQCFGVAASNEVQVVVP